MLLDSVRWLVYKMGFRPKPRALLYSPTALLTREVQQIIKYGGSWDQVKVLGEPTKGPAKKPTELTKAILLAQLTYCPICGGRLEPYLLDTKKCPRGHGRSYTTIDFDGFLVITFEPSDER